MSNASQKLIVRALPLVLLLVLVAALLLLTATALPARG
jgi:hypothetical protein